MEDNPKYIYLNLNYIKYSGKYKIKLLSTPKNQKLFNLLKNIYKIENIDLEIDANKKKLAFPITETIKVLFNNIKEHNFLCTTEEIKIFNSKPNHYLKFSIHGRNDYQFILSAAIVVYNEKKILFRAYNTITYSKLLNFSFNNCNCMNNKFTIINDNYEIKNNNRSYSLNNPRCFFLKKYKEISAKEEEINYNCSDIKSIMELTQSITTKVFGLENIGNTCFINSSLQILIHTPIFIRNFLKDISEIKPSNDTVAYQFYIFIMNIYNSNKKIFSPLNLISAFLKICNIFSLGEQSDSQRFYRNLATILDKEFGHLNTCINKTFKGELTNITEYNCPSPICETKQKTIAQQTFYDLILQVPVKESTVNNLLDFSFKRQIIKSNKKCKCKKNLEICRSSKIKLNEYLSVNIQRGKIETRTLKNTLIHIDNLYNENQLYEPYAINLHPGTMDYGHYYSYVKLDDPEFGTDGKWICFNDENATPMDDYPSSSTTVMNIFYKKYNL